MKNNTQKCFYIIHIHYHMINKNTIFKSKLIKKSIIIKKCNNRKQNNLNHTKHKPNYLLFLMK